MRPIIYRYRSPSIDGFSDLRMASGGMQIRCIRNYTHTHTHTHTHRDRSGPISVTISMATLVPQVCERCRNSNFFLLFSFIRFFCFLSFFFCYGSDFISFPSHSEHLPSSFFSLEWIMKWISASVIDYNRGV